MANNDTTMTDRQMWTSVVVYTAIVLAMLITTIVVTFNVLFSENYFLAIIPALVGGAITLTCGSWLPSVVGKVLRLPEPAPYSK